MFPSTIKEGRCRAIFVSVTITFILATIFVAARLITRLYIIKNRGWDNYCILLAWVFAFGISFAIDFGTSKGLGLHDVDIPAAWNTPMLVSEYVAIVLYNPALMATKTSILLLYLHLSRHKKKFLPIASYVTLAVVNVGGVALTFVTAFQCRPVHAAYNTAIADTACIPIETIYLASAPVNVATDLAILVLPIPMLTSLRLPRRQKTILVITFLLGAFVTVVDVVRIYYMQLAATSIDMLPRLKLTSLDFSYNASVALMWSAIEVNVGIICACIPTLRPLFMRLVPGMVSRPDYSSGQRRGLTEVSSSSQGVTSFYSQKSKTPLQPNPPTEASATVATELQMISQEQPVQEQQQINTEPRTEVEQETERPRTQQTERSVIFGFVRIEQQPKSMIDVQGLRSCKYWAVIAGLLFFDGFGYGMLLSVSSELFTIENEVQAIGISSAIYGGSAIGPFLGLWILRRLGFKATFVTSLSITCAGTLMFWPSGALQSYVGFIVSSVVVGFGLGLIDLTSNAYFMLCGPPRYAEFRLLLGQSVEAVAGVLSLLLSAKVFSVDVIDSRSFIVIQWAYLVIAVLTVFLGLFFYYIPLPEATDAELQNQLRRLGIDPSQKHCNGFPVNVTSFTMAALSAFCIGGGLVCIRTFSSDLFTDISTNTNTSLPLGLSDFNTLLLGIYAISQAIFAVLTLFVPPRILLLLAYIGCIIFAALFTAFDFPSVGGAETLALIFGLLGGSIPSLIFAIGMRGLGRWTKVAACAIESGIDFGACVAPFIMWGVLNRENDDNSCYSFGVVVGLFIFGSVYPLYVNLSRSARHLVDARSYECE